MTTRMVELPRPTFRGWLFGVRPRVRVDVWHAAGGTVEVEVSDRGCVMLAMSATTVDKPGFVEVWREIRL